METKEKEMIRAEGSETARQHKEFLSDMLLDKGIRTRDAAGKINISAERMYKYLNEDANINNFPAYLIPMLTKIIGPEYLQFLCAESDYITVKIPKKFQGFKDTVMAAAKTLELAGKAVAEYSKAIEDYQIDHHEWKKIQKTIDPAMASLASLRKMAQALKVRE
ncbi:MAG: hypothetical protein GY714_10630 [Desulfobacterales bacterium]|nr:hypothetical protein [Desulfobacterales bacterium]